MPNKKAMNAQEIFKDHSLTDAIAKVWKYSKAEIIQLAEKLQLSTEGNRINLIARCDKRIREDFAQDAKTAQP